MTSTQTSRLAWLIVSCLCFITPSLVIAQDEHLIAYWRFEEDSGSQVLDSILGHDGIIHGNVQRMIGGGVGGGNALEFNGIDGYVEILDIADFKFNNTSATIMGWVQLYDDVNEYRPFLSINSDVSGDDFFQFAKARSGLYEGRVFMEVHASTNHLFALSLSTGASLDKYTWIHFAGVVDVDHGKVRLYMNGVLQDAENLTSFDLSSASSVTIGSTLFLSGDEYHHGALDEVAVFNRALSASQISAFANAVPNEQATWSDIKSMFR
ncbi:MAG: LamG domain-containing protein [Ardenticatenia bacterium]|nr:LamG domain-containing protein [Ardenticatenia bacterium]